jgi:hypothetical protein
MADIETLWANLLKQWRYMAAKQVDPSGDSYAARQYREKQAEFTAACRQLPRPVRIRKIAVWEMDQFCKKLSFTSRREVLKWMKSMPSDGKRRDVYECPQCGNWHMTTSRDAFRARRRASKEARADSA